MPINYIKKIKSATFVQELPTEFSNSTKFKYCLEQSVKPSCMKAPFFFVSGPCKPQVPYNSILYSVLFCLTTNRIFVMSAPDKGECTVYIFYFLQFTEDISRKTETIQ